MIHDIKPPHPHSGDAVALADDQRGSKPPPPGWYGKRAPEQTWLTDARIAIAGVTRQIYPCFDLGEDMRKPKPTTYLHALLVVVVFLLLGAYVAWAVMGQRP